MVCGLNYLHLHNTDFMQQLLLYPRMAEIMCVQVCACDGRCEWEKVFERVRVHVNECVFISVSVCVHYGMFDTVFKLIRDTKFSIILFKDVR